MTAAIIEKPMMKEAAWSAYTTCVSCLSECPVSDPLADGPSSLATALFRAVSLQQGCHRSVPICAGDAERRDPACHGRIGVRTTGKQQLGHADVAHSHCRH